MSNSKVIRNIIQTNNGTIYIATNAGLFRLDTKEFRIFTTKFQNIDIRDIQYSKKL